MRTDLNKLLYINLDIYMYPLSCCWSNASNLCCSSVINIYQEEEVFQVVYTMYIYVM